MTKIFRSSFFRTTKPGLLDDEEEEEPLAGGYRDLEDGGGADAGDVTAGSGGGETRPRAEDALFVAVIVAYLVSCLAIYYLVIGSFYLPPEAGVVEGGREIVLAGVVLLAVAGPVLAVGLAVCCCCRSARGPSPPPVSGG
ncbi:unnamed protein product [Alopecurus aequalis]